MASDENKGLQFLENEARYHAYKIAASILQSSLDDKAVDGICQLNHFAEYTTGEVKKTIKRIIKALSAEAERYDKKRKI